MNDLPQAPQESDAEPAQEQAEQAEAPSLAEVAARRLAARTQWQKALARARERFNPVNVRDEVIETAADKIGTAADKAGAIAWAHRGKLAVAGLIGGLFFARKPIAKAAAPLADQAKATIDKAAQAIRDRSGR